MSNDRLPFEAAYGAESPFKPGDRVRVCKGFNAGMRREDAKCLHFVTGAKRRSDGAWLIALAGMPDYYGTYSFKLVFREGRGRTGKAA